MNYETILVEKKQNGILEIRLNRPQSLNALNEVLFRELLEAATAAEQDDAVRVIIITGEGRAFAAGADIGNMKDMDTIAIAKMADTGLRAYRKLEQMSKVVIAAVNGLALGGGFELALCCDLRIASSKAKFGLPETGLGIIPGSGGTQRLPRLTGPAKAKEMIFTGSILTADEALREGIVNKVVEPQQVLEEAYAMAEKILEKGPLAIRYAKEAVSRGMQVDIETGLEMEKDLFTLCFATQDQKEGMNAFFEKRPPQFTGR